MPDVTEEQFRRKFLATYRQCSTRGKCVAHLALICIGRNLSLLAHQLIELVGPIEPGRDAGPVDLDLVDAARMVLPDDEAQVWGLLLIEIVNTGNKGALQVAHRLLRKRISI